MARKPRDLTAEEQALWNKVIRQVARVESMDAQPPVRSVGRMPDRTGGQTAAPEAGKAGQRPSFVDRPAQTSPNMDRRNFQRLLKGRLDIDATLDLHGMRAERAEQRMNQFIRNAHAAGGRLLLIITGKGKTGDADAFGRPRRGILREGVPEWLKNGPMSGLVLQVTQAHPRHGGGGAYYVYLRRNRLK